MRHVVGYGRSLGTTLRPDGLRVAEPHQTMAKGVRRSFNATKAKTDCSSKLLFHCRFQAYRPHPSKSGAPFALDATGIWMLGRSPPAAVETCWKPCLVVRAKRTAGA